MSISWLNARSTASAALDAPPGAAEMTDLKHTCAYLIHDPSAQPCLACDVNRVQQAITGKPWAMARESLRRITSSLAEAIARSPAKGGVEGCAESRHLQYACDTALLFLSLIESWDEHVNLSEADVSWLEAERSRSGSR